MVRTPVTKLAGGRWRRDHRRRFPFHFCLNVHEPETDHEGVIDTPHGTCIQCAQALDEPFAFYGADLVQDHSRRLAEAGLPTWLERHLSRMRWSSKFGADGCHDRN